MIADGTSGQNGVSPDDLGELDYSRAERECDIVMKGGITSGVVYPHAICELARTYRFVNVGGTSAGAIAAAGAGAAEAGRGSGGFAKLAALPSWIAAGDNMLSLFQPQKSTKRLFAILIASLNKKQKVVRIAAALLRRYWLHALLGALPGLSLIALTLWLTSGSGLVPGILGGALVLAVGAVVGVGVGVGRDLVRLPGNDFGVCSGMGGPTPPALTPWLADLIDDLAGRSASGPPLTFGDLERAGVHLQLMTTNLTQRRPLRLPWVRREVLFFSPDQLRRFFPERVVAHLEQRPPASPEGERDAREWDVLCRLLEPLRPLPDPDNLPVVFGARISMSFPLLLSALPLWSVDWSLTTNQEAMARWNAFVHENPDAGISDAGAPSIRPEAEVCWFSDGGISSNFPVHFFDAPLPRRPTFAINLRGFHPSHPQSSSESENVYLPERSGGGLLEWWYRYPAGSAKQLVAFGESVVRTMQNRVDEAQMRVPGYRDRVVHVGTSSSEGGMNLNMPSTVITALTARGREAARKLTRRFAEPPASPGDLSWDSHRWTRYRASIAAIDALVRQVEAVYHGPPTAAGERSYAELIDRDPDASPRAYPLANASERQLAHEFTDAILAAAEIALAADPDTTLARGAPKPAPEARIVPRS
jgi:predicted acylesterase/phospholipase RssA